MKYKVSVIALIIVGAIGCASNKAPDVTGQIRNSLRQAGLTNVNVSQDRDKGVVTLRGNVARAADKARAEGIAQPLAGGQVVANEITVVPNGNQSAARSVEADIDKGIQANLDAALAQANIRGIHHSTKNGVVTLQGDAPTAQIRTDAERIAAGVPNVQQVVNEIRVNKQRVPTSSAPSSGQ